MEDYTKRQLKVFSAIHKDVGCRLLASKTEMSTQQHRRSSPFNIRIGESVVVVKVRTREKLQTGSRVCRIVPSSQPDSASQVRILQSVVEYD